IRESKKGEKITSLENKTYELPGGDIVIDDGNGTIIDLPGIIGTSNSVVIDSTKNILFFIDNNNPVKMRRTSMSLGIRTNAASLNEKEPDPKLAFTAFLRGIELYELVAGAKITSKYLDIYPSPQTPSTIKVYLKDIHRIMGIIIEEDEIMSILSNLGFESIRHENPELAYPDGVYFEIVVPTGRIKDIQIKEDIVEEIARIYGYHNFPNTISPMVYIKQPQEVEHLFKVQYKAKYFLKHIGLHEIMNYSMISKSLIEAMGMEPKDHLKLANTISTEIEYMRISLIPSLVKNIKDNRGKREVLTFFEIAKTYTERASDLPIEEYKLGIATTTDFADIKGIITSLFADLKITDFDIEAGEDDLLANGESAILMHKGKQVGILGKLEAKHSQLMELSGSVYVAEILFEFIAGEYTSMGKYTQPNQYAVVKLDTTIEPGEKSFKQIQKLAHATSTLLQKVEYISSYQTNISLRCYFTSPTENISEEIAKKELEKILKAL
ncbi:MAG: phenylalanine--tRNA ligase beta subunit-related protein, partial [bacterium]|nr:phenylalanine--tRNA ligase beta subunit-related protein [bacterium]